jgi:ferritin-like metal-binding protein YciE
MPVESLHELFIEELRDMYDGEKRILKALPKMAKAATAADLQDAFTSHLEETERQVERLEQVFEVLSERPRGKKCDGIMGILEEGNNSMQELDKGPVLDAALIAGAQKVEHYEIASYGTLAYFAELMGHEQAKELLGETLEEEKAADEKLNEIAKSDVNREALTAEPDGAENEEAGAVAGGGRGRRSASAAMAQDRGARGSRTTGSRGSTASRGSSGSRGRTTQRSNSSRGGNSSRRGKR